MFSHFPGGSYGKESAYNVRDPGSIPGSEISWRREWLGTPVSLPGESHGKKEPEGLQSKGLQRVRHD